MQDKSNQPPKEKPNPKPQPVPKPEPPKPQKPDVAIKGGDIPKGKPS